jgi:hypothetical protein
LVVPKDENGNTIDSIKLYHTDKEKMKNYFSSFLKGSVVALESCGFDHWLGDMLEELVGSLIWVYLGSVIWVRHKSWFWSLRQDPPIV